MNRTRQAARHNRAHLIVWWIALVIALYASLASVSHIQLPGGTHWHTTDDAMINLRVALNFFDTGQPYFNADEAVAASTSLLWPIILSPIYAVFDVSGALPFIIGLSAVMSAIAILISVSIIPHLGVRILAAAAIAMSPTLLRFGLSGWEHVPQMLVVSAAMATIWHASRAAGTLVVPTAAALLMALAFLLRVDIAVSATVVGLGWFLTEERHRSPRTYVILLGLCMVPLGYFGLMHHFYGAFVPNTAVLKMTGDDPLWGLGLWYVSNLNFSGVLPVLVLGLMICLPRSPAGRLILSAVVLHLAYVVAVGGDIFTLGRFFMVYLPITIALACHEVCDRAGLFGARAQSVSLLFPVVLAFAWQVPYVADPDLRDIADYGNSEGYRGQIAAVSLATEVIEPEDGSIGLHYLGIGYHVPDFHVVDFLGKAEKVIARSEARDGWTGHNKWDYDYAFSRYDIAVVPMFDRYAGAAATAGGANREHGFWTDAVRAMAARGYVYLPPERVGNAPHEVGLFVRPDLMPKFLTHLDVRNAMQGALNRPL